MLKKISSLSLIILFFINILFSENISANYYQNSDFQIKENFIQSNYNFTNYFKSMEDLYKYRKSIVIDTKTWNLKAYFYWQEIWSFNASVWNWYNQTPKWKFRIVQKNDLAKSRTSWLYMPNWMEFRWNWMYGIHWFPLYWDKTPKYKNEEKFSKMPLAWGCVRIEKENIKALYNWAELLTTVIVL